MKSVSLAILSLIASIATSSVTAATPEQEKAFVDAYKKALEAGDTKTLNGFLHTAGADEETLEFVKLMQEPPPGAKVVSVELVAPSAEEAAKLSKPMEMPNGKTYKMGLTPYKQLVVVMEEKSEGGSGKSTVKSPVAEKDGKLVIPVPVPADAAPAKEAKPKAAGKAAPKKN